MKKKLFGRLLSIVLAAALLVGEVPTNMLSVSATETQSLISEIAEGDVSGGDYSDEEGTTEEPGDESADETEGESDGTDADVSGSNEEIPEEDAALPITEDGTPVDMYSPEFLSEYRTGYEHYQFIEVSEEEALSKLYSPDESEISVWKGASYKTYSCYYIYNLLNAEQKRAWDTLEMLCENYLNSTVSGNLGFVAMPGSFANGSVFQFFYIFRESHPQYYFLDSGAWMSGNMLSPMIYSKFTNGSTRSQETKKFYKQVDTWKTTIENCPECTNDFEKADHIARLICDKVYYARDTYDQSAYSVMCGTNTVCAGYAMANELMCNALGIDAVTVTSYNHAWNVVRFEDNWYHVDVTWMDSDGGSLWYHWFARSYTEMQKNSSGSHTVESYWNGLYPNASVDTVPGSDDYYTEFTRRLLRSDLSRLSAPTVTSSGGKVTLKGPSGAKIYYTTDGTTIPSSSSTKSLVYSGAFSCSNPDKVMAVAVKPGSYDSPLRFRISYNLNGKGSKDPSATYPTSFDSDTPAESLVIADAIPSDSSKYEFAGWYNNKKLTGARVTSIDPHYKGNITLYAKWIGVPVTVTYYANSADGIITGSVNQTSVSLTTRYQSTYGKNADGNSVSLPTATRKGYTFVGWFTEASGGEKITSDTKVSVETTHTLYAHYARGSYRISFNSNGGTGRMSKQTVYYGVDTTLTANAFSRTGCRFLGWSLTPVENLSLSAAESVLFSDKELINDLNNETELLYDCEEVITLYAVWTNQASYTLVTPSGSLLEADASALGLAGDTLEGEHTYIGAYRLNSQTILPVPVITGYTFQGWYSGKAGDVTAYTNGSFKYNRKAKASSITVKQKNNLVYYSRWKKNTVTVHFNVNGGSGKMADAVYDYWNNSGVLPECTITRAGYDFAGWAVEKSGAPVCPDCGTIEGISEMTTYGSSEITLYAKWVRASYTVYFHVNKGTLTEEALATGLYIPVSEGLYSTFYVAGTGLTTLPAAQSSLEGMTFGGWYKGTETSCDYNSKKKMTSVSKKLSGDIHLYAQWKGSYRIDFVGGDATGEMNSVTAKNQTAVKLPSNTFVKEGYGFVGWAYADDASDTVVYKNGAKISNIEVTRTDEVIAGDVVINVLRLKPVWTDTVSVRFELGSNVALIDESVFGSVTGASCTVTRPAAASYSVAMQYGTILTKEQLSGIVPARTGYVFKGWYRDKKYKKAAGNLTGTNIDEVVLYAKWAASGYSVVYNMNKPADAVTYSITSSGTMRKQSMKYGSSKALTANAFAVKGYSFVGWSTEPVPALSDGASEASIASVVDFGNKQKINGLTSDLQNKLTAVNETGAECLVLYAVWKLERYSIGYQRMNLNELTNKLAYPTSYTIIDTYAEGFALPKITPYRDGFVFKGWYTDSKCRKKASAVKKGSTGNRTFYAKWVINS